MNPLLISAAIAAALGFGVAWQIQTYRSLDEENNRITQQIEAERELSRMEQARSSQVLAAQNGARLRESKLRLDASTARTASERLRDTLASTVPTTDSSPSACVERTTAVSELFAQCGQALGELAGTADRVNSDRLMLLEAWPK